MSTPEGWYDDGSGRQRWWDGAQWTHYAPAQQEQPVVQISVGSQPQGRMANNMGVSYVRAQKGHSLTGWIIASLFLLFPVIWLIYYSASPNHYWHA